jgi:hypothetical protein
MSASCQEERDCNSALDPGAVRKLSSVTVKSGPLTSVELDIHTLGVCSSSNTIFRHSVRSSWVHGHSTKHTTRYIPGNAMCVQNFDDSEIVQFILHIAFRCVLHRCRSQEIHCWKLYYISNDRDRGTGTQAGMPGTPSRTYFLWFLVYFVSNFSSGVGRLHVLAMWVQQDVQVSTHRPIHTENHLSVKSFIS